MTNERAETVVADQGDATTVIVGVGVGGASLSSLEQLIRHVEPGHGVAFVVAVRQDEGFQVETVLDVLSRATPLPVRIARDGARLDPDAIHIGARDDLLIVEGNHFRTRAAIQPIGHRGTIDSLLISIAEQAHEHHVTVILAHLGSEGTAGMTATKKFGGLSIAEISDEEGGTGAIGPAAIADLHLPVDRIWREVVRYVKGLAESETSGVSKVIPDKIEEHLKQIITALRNITSHDFHDYKRGTFIRRVQRRMQVLQVEDIDAYVAKLRADPQEVQNLFQDLLIGVTQFFRDPAEFEALERELPRLFEGKGPEDSFRVWVLGCATGEEAYSIAMLLREHMATLDRPPEVQIFATDLDARALGLARAGRYSDAIAQHVRPDRLQRWFLREGNTFCVAKELREMCVFSPHNIVKDAPFSRIDVLSCRNLLIYLNVELQNRVMPLFHFALRPGGLLFLGSSENVTRHTKLFTPVDRKNRLFRKLETATRVIPDFPLTLRPRGLTPVPDFGPTASIGKLTQAVSRQAELIAERYSPAYVVVDAQGDVLHFSGRTGRYIEPSAGVPTLNLPSLVHRDLRLDVRSALARAAANNNRVEMPRLALRQDDRTFGVTLVIEPVSNSEASSFLVLFQDLGTINDNGSFEGERSSTDEHVQRLEAELRVTRDRLQATVEEQESTNEELKSSNEEYQSINEEMQSANEELETSKEELQSVNEELQTVNGELGHRVSELGRINSDLKNLLESTQIATVFLDNDLRVRNFTPTATEIFHLLETDVGRPLDHVVSRVSYPELAADVRQVLKTLVPVERQVGDASLDRQFSARVLPYRSVDNYINGAVVTFTNLTEVLKAQQALQASEQRQQILIEGVPQLVWRATDGGLWTWVSPQWSSYTGQAEADSLGLGWLEVVHPDDRAAVMAQWDGAAERGELAAEYRLRQARDGAYRWFQTRATPVRDDGGLIVEWLGTSTDIDDLRQLQERQRVLVAELQHRTRNLIGIVRSLADRTLGEAGSMTEFGEHFGLRLEALGRVQGLLSHLSAGERVTFDGLIRSELAAMGADNQNGKVTLDGPEGVALRSATVQTFALALHELATNAVKYGALSPTASHGHLSVRWRLDREESPPGYLRVEWTESGVALSEGVVARQSGGYGRELIERALPYQMGAETTYELGGDGVRCTIMVPLVRHVIPGGQA